MARYTKTGTPTTIGQISAELDLIATAINDTYSRVGDTPNQLESALDANSNHIINLPAPTLDGDPIRKIDVVNGGDALASALLRSDLAAGTVDVNVDNDLSQAYEFATVAAYKAYAKVFPVGKVISLLDRGTEFTVVAGTGTANTYNIIASDQVSQSIGFSIGGTLTASHFGAKGDGTNEQAVLQFLITQANARMTPSTLLSTTIDLEHKRYSIATALTVREGGLDIINGTVTQTVNTNDVVVLDGTGNAFTEQMFNIRFLSFDLNIDGVATATSGSLCRLVAGNLGWFTWQGVNGLMYGGQFGFANGYGTATGVGGKIGGVLWALVLRNLWFHEQYESSVFIPSAGGVISYSASDGGTTTMSLMNVHATNLVSHFPAFQFGNGADHLYLRNVTADNCTRIIAAKVKTMVFEQVAMEFVREPLGATEAAEFRALPRHDLLYVQASTNLDLTGFSSVFASGLVSNPHPDTNHVYASAVNCTVSGILGGSVTTGTMFTVAGGSFTGSISGSGLSGTTLPARALFGAVLRDSFVSRSVSPSQITGSNVNLFAVDPIRPRVYLLTFSYNFANLSDLATFIVTTGGTLGGLRGTTVKLIEGADPVGITCTVTGGFVQASVGGRSYDWFATDLLTV
jgi:hypothetical protein